MALSTADILFRKAVVNDDTGSNGGRMSPTLLPDNLKNALFADVRQAERVAGSSKWRKVFLHFAPPDASQALDVRVVPFSPTPAGDAVALFMGTATDTQATRSAAPGRAYGAALAVVTSLAAGSMTVQVVLEQQAHAIFAAGDAVYVTDRESVGAAGQEEYATLDSVSAPVDSVVTLTFAAPLVNAYSGAIRVASVLAVGDVLPAVQGASVTSVAGTFAAAQAQAAPRSTVADAWTLTFTGASTFTAVGGVTGAVGSGSVSGTFAPSNAALGGPYFTLPPSCFGGTFAAGDTVTFVTVPAAVGLWLLRIVPPLCPTFAGNAFTVMVDLESA